MRRYVLTIVFSLLFAPLFGNDGIPNPRLFQKKSTFLLLRPLLVSQVPSMAKIFWFSLNTATA